MPRVEFESTTPVFERAKTVHALDRAATVIGGTMSYVIILVFSLSGQGKATKSIGQHSHLKEQLLIQDISNSKREYQSLDCNIR
jgi:tRNA A37 N6-isopentenylltransferase MiaA